MASIHEIVRGKKYRIVAELGYLPNGKRDRVSKVIEATGKREARSMAKEFEEQILNDRKYDKNMLFTDLADKWVENYASVELDVSTFEKYNSSLEVISSYFENYRISEIKPLHIIDFYKNEKKHKRRSFETKHKVLNSLFNHAIIWQIISDSDNPMKNQSVPTTEVRKQKKDFYRPHEVPILLNLLEEHTEEQKVMVLLALMCGLRRGEILGLTTEVCDFANNTLYINRSLQQSKAGSMRLKDTKTKESRTVFVPGKLMDRVRELHDAKLKLKDEMENLWEGFKDQHDKEVILLFSKPTGYPNRPDNVTTFWSRFTKRNKDKLRQVRFHDLRHSSASVLLSEGINIKVIQKRLGHKDIKTTLNLYAHVTEKDDMTASDLFDGYL